MSETYPLQKDKLPYTTDEAARVLGLSPKTLANWRARKKGPKYVHVSSKNSTVLYRYDDLLEWVHSLSE
jgi:hypothetical protein